MLSQLWKHPYLVVTKKMVNLVFDDYVVASWKQQLLIRVVVVSSETSYYLALSW